MKTACHEICHVFGITHCPYYECLMNGSNLINEADRKPFALCPICLRKIASYLNLDYQMTTERYFNLVDSIQDQDNPRF